MPYQPCYTKLAYIESENPTEGGKFFLIDPADIDELPEASHVWSVGEEIQYRVIKTGEFVQDQDGPYELEFPFRLKAIYSAYPNWVRLHSEKEHP